MHTGDLLPAMPTDLTKRQTTRLNNPLRPVDRCARRNTKATRRRLPGQLSVFHKCRNFDPL
jgi:hypothetical protein